MTTKFKNKVFEKISQQNIKTFKDLTCIINETKSECTKQFSIKIMNKNYWITPDYLKKLKERDKLYIRWKKIQNDYTENAYKKAKNEINKLRIKLQKQFAEKSYKKCRVMEEKHGKY